MVHAPDMLCLAGGMISRDMQMEQQRELWEQREWERLAADRQREAARDPKIEVRVRMMHLYSDGSYHWGLCFECDCRRCLEQSFQR